MLTFVYSYSAPPSGALASASRTWNMAANDTLAGYCVEHADADGRLLISQGRHLFQYKPEEPLWHVSALPLPAWQQAAVALHWRLGGHFTQVLPFSARTALITFGKHVYVVHDGTARPLLGLARPTAVHRHGCAVCPDGVVYFGECNRNRNRDSVHIYRWKVAQARAEIAYTFPRQSIRGVYAVVPHPDDGSLWVCTGDLRGECRILRTDDGFRTLEVIGAGDESWRASTLRCVRGQIYYATAGERLLNKVYRLDPVSGSREDVGEVGGPVHDTLRVDNDMIFAVRGTRCPCNPEGEAALWHLDAHHGLHKLVQGCAGTNKQAASAFHLVQSPKAGFWFSTLDALGRPLQTFFAHRRS